MKKLLHERLRDGEGAFIIFEVGEYSFRYHRDIAEAFADEIERYYIPRPRFEDGEPIDFNEDCECDGRTWWVAAIGEDDVLINRCEHGTFGVVESRWENPMNLKRPSPKVLDADGVEIKVGDTVWDDRGIKHSVNSINFDDDSPKILVINDESAFWSYAPGRFTHKEPDSLEKLRDDIKQVTEQKDVTYGDMEAWVSRLSALIKREG